MEGCRILQDVTGCSTFCMSNQMFTTKCSPEARCRTSVHTIIYYQPLTICWFHLRVLHHLAALQAIHLQRSHITSKKKLGTNQKPLKHFETVFTFDLVTFTYIIWLYLVWMHTSLSGPVDITVEKLGSRKSPTSRRNIFRKHPGRHCACWKRQLSVFMGQMYVNVLVCSAWWKESLVLCLRESTGSDLGIFNTLS